jgi:adenylate cyclase
VHGWALAAEENAEEGFAAMRRSVDAARASGARVGQTLLLVHLAESCLRRGALEEGRRLLDDMDAEASLRRALDVARRQHNRTQELRAATALAVRWRDSGRRVEARELLEPLYRCWVEGLDTVDVAAARAVLESLA